jgi:DNA-binding XRE family transcriptional regulator
MPKRKNPPVIHSVEALSPYMLRLTWKNGVEADVDVSEVITTYQIYEPLRADKELWAKVRVASWGWYVQWTEEIDMSGETIWRLYQEQTGEVMRQADFFLWRKNFHLSQEKAAHILGISRRTVINYEKGEQPIPKYICLACKGAELEMSS